MACYATERFTIPQDGPVLLWMVEGLYGQWTLIQWATPNDHCLWTQVAVGPVTVECWVVSHMGSTDGLDSLFLIVQSPLGLTFLYAPANDAPGRVVSKNFHNQAHNSSANNRDNEKT
jgi:hypothetical protein